MIQAPSPELTIAGKVIGPNHPVFFIADIAANHDGDLERAKDLIHLAATAGADAAKFQHFSASTIVSDHGFRSLDSEQLSHQSAWVNSVFEVYEEAAVDVEWTSVLKETCDEAGVTFFTSPYSHDLVDAVDPYVSAYKVGSGDITWIDIIRHMAGKGKPVLIAAGASTMDDVHRAVAAALELTGDVALMQCNTNYTASLENFAHINLRVLDAFRLEFPGMVLGLSDHTPGHSTVLGAVAMGARVIEKHFTDDQERAGPDHKFSMDPGTWREMVDRARELEAALGSGTKVVEDNEQETVVLQRRAIRAVTAIGAGTVLTQQDLEVLRPCPHDGLAPYVTHTVVGRRLDRDVEAGAHIRWTDLV